MDIRSDQQQTPDAALWDERYRSRVAQWDPEPNPHLARVAAGLTPGTALDVGCGEGSDAVWLANHGWHVTAVDISQVALDRGKAHDPTGRVTWTQADLGTWKPPAGTFDLVSSQFVHFPPEGRQAFFEQLAIAVKPGGTLLIVAHHPTDAETTVRRPPREVLFAAEAVELDPRAWDVTERARSPRTMKDPDGRPVTVHDAVLVATRRA